MDDKETDNHVKVKGIIIDNTTEYAERWESYMQTYQNDKVTCSIISNGIHFSDEVETRVDGEKVLLQEAELSYDIEKLGDINDILDLLIGNEIEFEGRLVLRNDTVELIGPVAWKGGQKYTYHPNGPYCFIIESYTLNAEKTKEINAQKEIIAKNKGIYRYYKYYDIDGNGTKELLFKNDNIDLFINEIFAFDGSKMVNLFSNANSLALYQNGIIAVFSGDADYYVIDYNGYSLVRASERFGSSEEVGRLTSMDYELIIDDWKNVSDNSTTMSQPELKTVQVTDIFSDSIWDDFSKKALCYHIPQILLDGEPLESENARIYNCLYDVLKREVYDTKRGTKYNPELADMAYSWGQKDEAVSVIVETNQLNYAWTEYYVYNISAVTGEELSAYELLRIYDISEEEFYTQVKSALNAYWDVRRQDVISFVGEDEFHSLVERTVADESIKKAIPYVGTDGELCMVAAIFSPAGADYYLHLLKMSGKEIEGGVSSCPVNHVFENLETEAESTAPFYKTGTIEESDLLGDWMIDETYTMSYNNTGLRQIFGSSYNYGNGMKFDIGNYFDYYIAAGEGGKGSYQLSGFELQLDIITYEEEKQVKFKMDVTNNDGVTRLLMDEGEYCIFWVKK
ncbi:MAG: hypothetical protein ACI39W_09930 [Brotaphodocola sp.]